VPTVYDASGQPLDLSHEQATAAVAAGQAGFLKGSQVHVVTKDGTVGSVAAEQAPAAFADGARLATDDEVHHARVQAKYGGFGGQVATGLLGAASGASLGLTDLAAQALGGGQYVEEHREANPNAFLAGQVAGGVAPMLVGDEAGAAGALEAAGKLGEAAKAGEAATEGAQGVSALARAGEATRAAAQTIGAPTRGVAKLGEGIEHVVRGVLDAEGEGSAITGLARKALAKGAGAAAEGALIGGANEIDEDALGDHEVNGEKVLAALGHGALLGLATGAGLSAAGELGSRVLGRTSPTLSGMAEEQAFRAINPRKAFATEADRIPGGIRGVGRRLLDEGIVSGGDTVESLAPKIAEARARAGEDIGSILESADNAKFDGPSVKAIEDRIRQSVLPELQKLGGTNKGAIAKVETLLSDLRLFAEGHSPMPDVDDVFRIGLAPSETAAPRTQRALEINASHEPGLRVSPDAALEGEPGDLPSPIDIRSMRGEGGKFQRSVNLGGRLEQTGREFNGTPLEVATTHEPAIRPEAFTDEAGAIRKPIRISNDEALSAETAANLRAEYDKNLRLSFKQAQEFRARLDDVIKWNTNPLGPVNEAAEAMKKIRGVIEDELEQSGERAAQKMGGSFLDEYKEAKLAYRQLTVADKAAQDAVTRNEANRVISPSDYITGAAMAAAHHGAGALAGGALGAAAGGAEGGEGGALAGFATGALGALAHHAIRTHGNSVAAVMLDKLAALRGVERAVRHVDNQIERGVGGFFGEEGRIPVKLREPLEGEGEEHAAETAHRKVLAAASQPDAHAAAIENAAAPIAEHAPKTANAFQRAALRGTMYLAENAPKVSTRPSITPQFDRPAMSDAQRSDYQRQVQAVHDPVSVLKDMELGRVTRAQVDALRMVYPSMYQEITERVHERLADLRKPLSYGQKVQLSMLLGVPADETLSPQFVQAMQKSFAPAGPPGGGGGGGGKHGAPRTQRPMKDDFAKNVELAVGEAKT